MSPDRPPQRGEVWWVAFDPALGGEIRKATNALEPTYFRGNVSERFVGTATARPVVISDPLHPQFRRN